MRAAGARILVRLKALIVKELLSILRDPKSRVVVIVPPLVQLFVFTFAATQEVTNIHLAVLDEDRSDWSYELIERFRASPRFSQVVQLDGAGDIRPLLDRQGALLVLRIGPTFARDLGSGRAASVQVILDGRRSNAAQIAQGYVETILSGFAQDRAAEAKGPPGSTVAQGAAPTIAHGPRGGGSGGGGPQVAVVARNWFNPNLIYRWFTVPSIIALLMTVTGLMVTGLSIARERELATFDQVLVSPLTAPEILIGKAVPALMIGGAQAVFFVFVAVIILGIPFKGSLLLLFFSLGVFVLAITGIGLFISAVSQTQQQAILGAFAFLSPAVLLSGFASPVDTMPRWLQVVAEANPLKHFMIVARGLFLKSMPADLVLANTWPLAVIAAATLTAAALAFGRKLR